MSWGYERQERIFLNNSKPLTATLYSTDGSTLVPQANITNVTFTVVKPTDDPASPTLNQVNGTVVDDGKAVYVIDASVNDTAGEYHVVALFTFTETGFGTMTKSVPLDYEVADPFERTMSSPADGAVRQAWFKLERNFDSENGGPWLRDMAVSSRFDQSTLRGFIPETLLAINQQMPFTDYTEAGFPYEVSDGEALMAQGLLCSAIRDLLRAYTEQPNLANSPVAFEDRRDYQQRWQQTLTTEQALFDKWLKQYKLRAYDLSHASVLVGSKAGRMLPAPMRSRNFGRGY